MSYRYWILRYVPNVARGEFTNIGILCGRDGADWAIRFDTRAVRNRGNLSNDLSELRPWISWFQRRVDRHGDLELEGPELNEGWVSHLRSRQANSIQFSEARPIDVPNAEEGVGLLFPHLVEREIVRRKRALTRVMMRTEIRDALQVEFELTPGRDFYVQPKAAIGKQRSTFDFMRHDGGKDALTNVWAFNVADVESLEQQVQASNYFLTRLRNDGAKLQLTPTQSSAIEADTPVSVIFDPPKARDNSHGSDVFEAAREAWELNNVHSFPLNEFRSMTAVSGLMSSRVR